MGRRLSGPGLWRGHWTAAGRPRSRRETAEAEADAPVFQYVGERATRADRIFVWGFSFSGALGVPTFVLPGSGPQPRAGSRPRRRIQAVPYRLELDQKVRISAPSLPPCVLPSGLGRASRGTRPSRRGWRRWVAKLRRARPSSGLPEGSALGCCQHVPSGRNVPGVAPGSRHSGVGVVATVTGEEREARRGCETGLRPPSWQVFVLWDSPSGQSDPRSSAVRKADFKRSEKAWAGWSR